MEVTDKFKQAHSFTAKWEGGYSDDEFDPGGVTKYGVCIEFLKDFTTPELERIGVQGPVTRSTIVGLTREKAERALFLRFWDDLNLEQVPMPMALCVYDYAMNCGAKNAVKRIQRDWNDELPWMRKREALHIDGVIGPKTIAALTEWNTMKGIHEVCEDRRIYYRTICDRNPKLEKFHKGWKNRVRALEEECQGYF